MREDTRGRHEGKTRGEDTRRRHEGRHEEKTSREDTRGRHQGKTSGEDTRGRHQGRHQEKTRSLPVKSSSLNELLKVTARYKYIFKERTGGEDKMIIYGEDMRLKNCNGQK